VRFLRSNRWSKYSECQLKASEIKPVASCLLAHSGRLVQPFRMEFESCVSRWFDPCRSLYPPHLLPSLLPKDGAFYSNHPLPETKGNIYFLTLASALLDNRRTVSLCTAAIAPLHPNESIFAVSRGDDHFRLRSEIPTLTRPKASSAEPSTQALAPLTNRKHA